MSHLLLTLASFVLSGLPAHAHANGPHDARQAPTLDQAYRIDLSRIDLTFDLDVPAETLSGSAKLSFRLRPGQSRPLFHFSPRVKGKSGREVITSIQLDGSPLDPLDEDDLKSLPIRGARRRALEVQRELAPERDHVLSIEWSVPNVFAADEPGWLRTNVDDSIGRGNEVLWPTINSPEELARHTIAVRVHGGSEYVVIGSGRVERQAETSVPTWVLDTEREVASYTVMLAVIPAQDVTLETFEVADVPVTLAAVPGPKRLRYSRRLIEDVLARLVGDFGTFPMNSLHVLLLDWDGGMEYYGATITGVSALEHELVHMYWGCSAVNRSWRDTWIDEAITTWWSEREDLEPLPEDFATDMVAALTPTQPAFDLRAYDHGARIMAEIARALGGDDAMLDFLAEVHGRRAFVPFSTEEFIADVVAASESPQLGESLRRWLYSPKKPRSGTGSGTESND